MLFSSVETAAAKAATTACNNSSSSKKQKQSLLLSLLTSPLVMVSLGLIWILDCMETKSGLGGASGSTSGTVPVSAQIPGQSRPSFNRDGPNGEDPFLARTAPSELILLKREVPPIKLKIIIDASTGSIRNHFHYDGYDGPTI